MPKPKTKLEVWYFEIAIDRLHCIACHIADIIAFIGLWYCSVGLLATHYFITHPYLLTKYLTNLLLGPVWRFLFPSRSKPERYRARLVTDCERLVQQFGLVLFFLPLFFAYSAVEFSSVLHTQGKRKLKVDSHDLLYVHISSCLTSCTR
jgi:hypothetical protein